MSFGTYKHSQGKTLHGRLGSARGHLAGCFFTRLSYVSTKGKLRVLRRDNSAVLRDFRVDILITRAGTTQSGHGDRHQHSAIHILRYPWEVCFL